RGQIEALEAEQAQAALELSAAEAAVEAAVTERERTRQVEQGASDALPALDAAVQAAVSQQSEAERRLSEVELAIRVNEANHANAAKALQQWVARRERLEASRNEIIQPVTSQIAAVQ